MEESSKYWDSVVYQKNFTHQIVFEEFEKYVNHNGAILDYGCGYGRTIQELHGKGFTNLFGVDYSLKMLERAKTENPFAQYFHNEGFSIPLEDNSFDAIILCAVLTCIPDSDEQKKLFAELNRVLKTNGIIYISDYLVAPDERNQKRYEKFESKYNCYGVFELEEGVVLRHHEIGYLKQLTKDFEVKLEEKFQVTTMNGNTSLGIRFIVQKSKIDKKMVECQYKNPSNFAKRREVHEKFGTNKYDSYKWLFDHFDFSHECKILELGSGLGTLWLNNQERIQQGWNITLTDFSQEMLDNLKQNLENVAHPFNFQLVNIENIPYANASFDVVIANGLLYLVPDLEKAIKEIARVLRHGGVLIASTSGSKYMKELEELIEKNNLPVHRGYTKYSFSLDNGKDLLLPSFSKIELFRNENALLITEAEPLADYILSTNENLSEEKIKIVRSFFDEYFKKNDQFKITIDTGLFIAKK